MKNKRKFAFLIHPREAVDVGRRLGKIFGIGENLGMKIVPEKFTTGLIKYLDGRLGFTVCSRFDVFGEVEGYIIAVLLTAEQMVSLSRKFVLQRILDAVLYAQDYLGVEGIGLGAYTAPLTRGGKWLVEHPAIHLWVTHGDTYSAALAIEGVKKIAALRNLDLKTTKTAIVGAYGIVGSAVTKELLSECGHLILVGRNEFKFANLLRRIPNLNGAKISVCLSDVCDADLIITATTGESAILQPQHLKKNVIVYDVAQPYNLKRIVCKERKDILRVDGSYAYIDGINIDFEMGPPKKTTFGCLAETIMQAIKCDRNNYVGDVDMEHLHTTQEWADEIGFRHAYFTNFSEPILNREAITTKPRNIWKTAFSVLRMFLF